MRVLNWLKKGDEGNLTIISVVIIFAIVCVFGILMNVASLYITYTAIESKIQRSVNSAVEYSIMDSYRADGELRMDTVTATAKLQEYLASDLDIDSSGVHYKDGQEVFHVVFSDTEITASPPDITVKGTVVYQTPLSIFGQRFSATYDFDISSHTVDIS